MNDDEIYQKLKSGEAPRYIKGIEGFDDSEIVQWMASYHEQVKDELLEALQACEKILSEIPLTVDLVEDLLFARDAIARALGQ